MPLKSCGIWSLFARAMGCLFGCFRIKDNNKNQNHRHHHPSPPRLVSDSVKSKEAPVSKNQLSSLIRSGDEVDALVVKERENLVRRSAWSELENDDRELRDEAKFLKACGALQETPAEIRKLSKKFKDSPPYDANPEQSKFHSWLPDASVSVLIDGDKQLDESLGSTKHREERETNQAPEQDSSPISCLLNKECHVDDFISSAGSLDLLHVSSGISETAESSISTAPSVSKSQRHKSVRFESEPVLFDSSPQITGQDVEKPEFTMSARMRSPFPTPLKVTDEMQTPGTVFATNLGNQNNVRIRSQFVNTVVMDPSKDPSNVLMQDGMMPLSSITETGADDQEFNRTPYLGVHAGETSVNREHKVGLSLEEWLKPPSPGVARPAGKSHEDRPIIGLVAAHWKEEEELPHISPKRVVGNGIPNSTTKYKEDQKVSWHATPFEERLEKALSEVGGNDCQRRAMSGTPIAYKEHDSDAATPQFQSLSCPESVTAL